MVEFNKALNTASVGIVKVAGGLAAGVKTVGKFGARGCSWIYNNTGLKGAVKKASQEYTDFKTDNQEAIDRGNDILKGGKEKLKQKFSDIGGGVKEFSDEHGISDAVQGAKEKVTGLAKKAESYEEVKTVKKGIAHGARKAKSILGSAWKGLKNIPSNIKERASMSEASGYSADINKYNAELTRRYPNQDAAAKPQNKTE